MRGLKYFFSWSLLAIMLPGLLLTSCSSDCDELIEEKASLSNGFLLSVKVGDGSTFRLQTESELDAAIKDKESVVDKLTVFVFESMDPNSGLLFRSDCNYVKEQDGSSLYRVPVSDEQTIKLQTLDKTAKRRLVLVANHTFGTSDVVNDYESLKSIVDRNSDLNKNNIDDAASLSLPMVGMKEIALDYPNNKNLGNVSLVRRVSKIKVIDPMVDVPGYELVGMPKVALHNGLTSGYLDSKEVCVDDNGYTKTDLKSYFDVLASGGGSKRYPMIFYTYYNKWGKDRSKQPTVVFALKLKEKNTPPEKAKVYYYKARIDNKDYNLEELDYNTAYILTSEIKALGSLDLSEPVELDKNSVFVKQEKWDTGESVMTGATYLYLSVHSYDMVHDDFEFEYSSSSPIKDVTVQECYYSYLERINGNEKRINLKKGDEGYPDIQVDRKTKKVKVHSIVPDNFMIRTITIRFTNGDNIKDYIKIKRFPPIGVESIDNSVRDKYGKVLRPHVNFRFRVYYEDSNLLNEMSDDLYKYYCKSTAKRTNTDGLDLTNEDDRKKAEPKETLPLPTVKNIQIAFPTKMEVFFANNRWSRPVMYEKYKVGPFKIVVPQVDHNFTLSPSFDLEYYDKDNDNLTENGRLFALYNKPFRPGVNIGAIYYPMDINQYRDQYLEKVVLNYNWFIFGQEDTQDDKYGKGDNAVEYCTRRLGNKGKNMYGDRTIKGKQNGYTDWRLPTGAELQLILKIQDRLQELYGNDGKIIGNIPFWDACGYYFYDKRVDPNELEISTDNRRGKPRVIARCVRDVKELTDEW